MKISDAKENITIKMSFFFSFSLHVTNNIFICIVQCQCQTYSSPNSMRQERSGERKVKKPEIFKA